MSYQCALHPDTPITHFCQSCMDLVCEKCTTRQPHSGSIHKIKEIQDSANIRKNMYAEYVENQVNVIRSECQKKISTLENLKKDTERDKKVIEKDIKIEFEAINNRLQSKQSQAIIGKQTEIKHLQNYVHSFDDLSSTFDSIYENPQGMLISYKIIDAEVRKLESLKHNLVSELRLQDKIELSREFEATVQKGLTLPQYEDRNQFVNKIIHQYAKSFSKKLKQTEQSCKKEGKQYKHTYNNIFKKVIADQVAKVCAFCGFPFTIAFVNEQCANNRSFKITCIYPDVDWESIIPQDIRGTKRHFWVKSATANRKRPKLQEHSMIRKTTKKHYWNSLQQLQTIKHVLKHHEIKTGQNFEAVVSGNDSNKTGYISKIAFVYTMSKIYLLSKQQIESLINLLQDEKGVNYSKLDGLLQNPTQDYYKFVEEEQQMMRNKPVAPPSVYSRFKY